MHTFSADILDIIFDKTNNNIYSSHKSIVNDTILWTSIFLAAYLCQGETNALSGTDVRLLDMFLLSRLVLSIGYNIGVLIGLPSLRLLGFSMGFAATAVMLAQGLGYSVLRWF